MNTDTKPKYTLRELTAAAASVLGLFEPDLLDTGNLSRHMVEQRYLTFALMEKAGYTHEQIGEHFSGMTRENVCKALAKLDDWLRMYKDVKGHHTRLLTLILKEV